MKGGTAMTTENDHAANLKKLGDMIEGIGVGMMTTAQEDGILRSRPMATLHHGDFDGDLWFFTEASLPKVGEVEHEPQVNISYAEPKEQQYVSVSGTTRVVRDRPTLEKFWNPLLKAGFPKGLDDPDLTLLRVRVEQAEYWDSPSNRMVQLIGFAKALATGTRYEQGEDEKINLTER